jgi:hypothetical protein
MKAQNLTISVPDNGCDKNCPYCVSKMTGRTEPNVGLMRRNIEKVRSIADVSSVLFTGKGEPLLNWDELKFLMIEFKHLPIELQTNGLKLLELANARLRPPKTMLDTRLRGLIDCGLNVMAISIDRMEDFNTLRPVFDTVLEHGLILRIAVNISDMLITRPDAGMYVSADVSERIVNASLEVGAHQLLLRRIAIPTGALESKYTKWIDKHVPANMFDNISNALLRSLHVARPIRVYPHVKVYDYRGLSISLSDYCIQDSHGEGDLRSLIFQEDGHVYTSWNSRASVLF